MAVFVEGPFIPGQIVGVATIDAELCQRCGLSSRRIFFGARESCLVCRQVLHTGEEGTN